MKRKGFTLIELLAVIVILAIIALIAVPTIIKVVEKSKKGSALSSAYGYIDAVEKYIMMHDLDSKKYPYDLKNNTWNVVSSTEISLLNLFFDTTKASSIVPPLNDIISVKGDKPSSGTVTIGLNGKVESANLKINKYYVTCNDKKCNVMVPYTVSYNANGGTGTMEDTKNEIVANTFTKEGYVFKEWNTKSDGSGDTYTETSMASGDITLYAIWETFEFETPVISIKRLAGALVMTDEGIVDGTSSSSSKIKIYYQDSPYLKHLYSEDNGITWKEYTNEFETTASTIMAKSVFKTDKNSSSDVKTQQLKVFPGYIFNSNAYDIGENKDSTYYLIDHSGKVNFYIHIDPYILGKKIRLKQWVYNNSNYYGKMYFRNIDNGSLYEYTLPRDDSSKEFTLVDNTYAIQFYVDSVRIDGDSGSYRFRIYDISLID